MKSHRSLDRFRGWILMLLYAVMVLFGVLLAFATLSLWTSLGGQEIVAGLLIATSLLTTATSLKSLQTFIKVLRVEQGVPKLELAPFFFILVSILIASQMLQQM